MTRLATVIALALGLAACGSDGYDHPLSQWERPPEPSEAAGQTAVVVARQAKEAQCKAGVEQRPGSTGTYPGDYKCKDKKFS
jgi:hypothetical protein